MKKKRKSPKRIVLRFRKKDPAHNLVAACQHWIIANGGDALVMGSIQIMRMPGDPESKFSVVLPILGRAPQKKEPA